MDQLKKYSPQFQHVHDTLAFVVHLSFLAKDCKLVGLSEEQYLEDIGSCPQGWNKSKDIYQFRYISKGQKNEEEKNQDAQPRNSMLVKILAMEDQELLITAVKQGSDDVFTLEISLSDHINVDAKNINEYQSVYKDIDGLRILLEDQITLKVVPQKKEKAKGGDDDKKKKKRQKAEDDGNPLIFPEPNHPNPLLIGGGRRPGGGMPFGGGFGGDMDPFGGMGGNLMGPDQIHQQWNNRQNPNNGNIQRPPKAKFDPFGPGGDFPNGPDPDHFKPPGGGRGGFGGGGFGGGGGGGFGGFI